MKKFSQFMKKVILKHGDKIACCAFAFLAFTSNSSSMVIFHEPEEPAGIERFKKFKD